MSTRRSTTATAGRSTQHAHLLQPRLRQLGAAPLLLLAQPAVQRRMLLSQVPLRLCHQLWRKRAGGQLLSLPLQPRTLQRLTPPCLRELQAVLHGQAGGHALPARRVARPRRKRALLW